jgi:hypothetical protein
LVHAISRQIPLATAVRRYELQKRISCTIIGLVAFIQLIGAAEYSGSVVHIVDGDTFDMDVWGAARIIETPG